MTKIITKILAPFGALIAFIMLMFDFMSAVSRVNTGIKGIIFISNETSSAITSYNNFANMRDGFYNWIFQTIFNYVPFLHSVPDEVWGFTRGVILLGLMLLCIKLYIEASH